jgi:Ulp1 family protease
MRWIMCKEVVHASDEHIFMTHFYTKLVEKGVEAVSQWTVNKDIDIFTKKLIFILVNLSLHWFLSVVINPSSINWEHKSVQDVISYILFFDHSRNEISKNIIAWLNMEWKRVKNVSENLSCTPTIKPNGKNLMDL